MFSLLSSTFSSIFSHITGKGYLSEQNMQEALERVRMALIEADVPLTLVSAFIDEVKKEAMGKKVLSSLKPAEQLIKIVHDTLLQFLKGGQTVGTTTAFSFQLPATVMVFGLQGSGKTTTIAKMAYYTQKQAEKRGKKRTILLASVDFYRPAAIDQLEILAHQTGCLFYRSPEVDPVKAARDIQAYAKHHSIELLFLDTAGRLHVDTAMLDELAAIEQLVAPRYKILVLDAMTGQESLRVAQSFEMAVSYHYAILSKMDSDSRGGAAFSFRYAQKKPILFVGSGEKINDLEQFYPERVAGSILGMGDIVTLAERAQEQIKQSEQEAIEKSLQQGRLTLQDFANQLEMLNRMGSLTHIMRYMPGLGSSMTPTMIAKGETTMKHFKAIISSMTPKERNNPSLLNGSRKLRIAKGAGVQVSDINHLLERFEESQQYAKLFKKMSKGSRLFR